MKWNKHLIIFLLIISLSFSACDNQKTQSTTKDNVVLQRKDISNPLASWNDTKAKQRIIDFVNAVTVKGSADYIPPEDRIATFDNDGTLWSEKPTYFQIEFVLDRIKQLSKKNHDWEDEDLIEIALKRDIKTLREEYGAEGLGQLMAIAQAGITTDEFDIIVKGWIKKAKHPITGKSYSQMVFQPMLELIKYLQNSNFKVYIVSGGGVDFLRAFSKEVYGIPREQIIGSYDKLEYKKVKGKPVLIKSPELMFPVDGKNKAIIIHQVIGKKPVISFGNSDGDLQMLEWCSANKRKSLSAYIHHTDSKREWAYDRKSHTGRLDKGLDAAAKNGWLVVNMKKDWKVIHPYELTEKVTTK